MMKKERFNGKDERDIFEHLDSMKLSVLLEKINAYRDESYFRESWYDFHVHWGNQKINHLNKFTFILFKPDAIAARKIEPTILFMRDNGFEPFYCSTFKFTRFTIRELWRYELNIATQQRIDAIDVLLPACDSLVVFFRDNHRTDDSLSASNRLFQLKGSAVKEGRAPGQLRYAIDAGTGLLNHIHAPDETMDLVREIGVFYDRKERAHLIKKFVENGLNGLKNNELEESIQSCYRSAPHHNLDVFDVLKKIQTSIKIHDFTQSDQNEIALLLKNAHANRAIDWSRLLALCTQYGIALSEWEQIVLIAACTECNLPESKQAFKLTRVL